MKIIERVFMLLEEKGKKAADLARFLNISTSVTSTWKTRGTNPPSEYIAQICEFLDVPIDFLITGKTQKNNNAIPIFEKLSPTAQIEIEQYAQYLLYKNEFLQYKEEKEKSHLHMVAEKQAPYSPDKNRSPIIIGHIKEETDSVKEKELHILGYTAAGEPIDMPDDIYGLGDVIKVPANTKADFALTVKGDSMEPRILNGSLVYVKMQDTVDNGQIAIVSINNTVTCKKFKKMKNAIRLESINASYAPIIIDNEDIDFKIIGKVINPK